MVGAEHDLRSTHQHFQRLDVDGIRRRSRVVVEPAKMIQLRVRLRRARQVLRAAFVAEEAPGERGDGSAAMRKNVADVGSARGCPAGNETDDRTANIGVVLNGGLINTRQEISATA